jgi:putative DNA primase/helicase
MSNFPTEKRNAQGVNGYAHTNGHHKTPPATSPPEPSATEAAPYCFPINRGDELLALRSFAHSPKETRATLKPTPPTPPNPLMDTAWLFFKVPESQALYQAFSKASANGEPVRERVEAALEAILAEDEHALVNTKLAQGIFAELYEAAAPEGTPARWLEKLRQQHEAELAPPKAQAFSLDEIGNGQRFAYHYGADMRFCSVRQTWIIFKNGRWQVDENGAAEARAKAIGRLVAEEAARETDDDRRARLLKHAVTLTKRATRETMLKDAASEPGIMVTPEGFDTAPHLFNVANGTLDLNTFQLRPHDPADLLTHYSPVVFTLGADCPVWRRCLDRWLPDQATRDYCQETYGLSLSGTVFEAFFNFLFGDGDNGKSTFLRVLELLAGSYSHKTQAETIMQARDQRKPGAPAPELLALKGARLVTVHEIDSKHKLNATLIKDLTGNDAITARGLFDKRPTTFEPQFTLWMFGNGKPQIPDASGGMWRRVRLIHFGQPIPKNERDPHLSAKLRAELPGILNWALEGLRRVNERGELVVPDAIAAATADYRAEQDPLTDFLRDCCAVGPGYTSSAADLWPVWCDWCREGGEREGTQRKLGAELTQRKFERYRNNGIRWRGLGILHPNKSEERNERNERNEIPNNFPIENSYAKTLSENGSVCSVRSVLPGLGREVGEL